VSKSEIRVRDRRLVLVAEYDSLENTEVFSSPAPRKAGSVPARARAVDDSDATLTQAPHVEERRIVPHRRSSDTGHGNYRGAAVREDVGPEGSESRQGVGW
jgi:hypothetical protein